MPIFHDHYDSPPRNETSRQSSADDSQLPYLPDYSRRLTPSAEPEQQSTGALYYPAESSTTLARGSRLNRVELIERIKRGSSKRQQLRAWSSEPASEGQNKNIWTCPTISSDLSQNTCTAGTESRPNSRDRQQSPPSRPSPVPSRRSRPSTPETFRQHASAGLEIQRPTSALHSGDFREEKEDPQSDNASFASAAALATSPVAPWHPSFPAGAASTRAASPFPGGDGTVQTPHPLTRLRAVSQSSFSSPFVFMPPTSPLVQQSNNTDLDSARSSSPERSNRRHTFSPRSFHAFQSSHVPELASERPLGPQSRTEGEMPYQAHQPRRSITSFSQFHTHSSPQTPLLLPRRPSIPSDASPLHHAPLVGSYEESILRGRMSTTPSRPLNFVARIGVLGKGDCKPNLRFPAHVTVPFPAVFYSYNNGNNRITDNTPSPYVGLIDLENSLPPPDESGASKRKRRHTVPNPENGESGTAGVDTPTQQQSMRKREKNRRRSTSPKAPPGGSYRIPQQGQLQIVIKNPNKTAVKLFLVPYDLSGMEPGQKTFIRQRSYSAGPVIDMPLSKRTNLGTDRPEAALSNSDDPKDRPVLRYLVHLHICCPSKGRYFLYKSIRVVFANRVPDDKEKLRHETQLPDPPYSTYKPSRESTAPASASAAERLTAEKAFRRRSAGIPLSARMHGDSYHPAPQLPPAAIQFSGGYTPPLGPVLDPIPFSLSRTVNTTQPASSDEMDLDPQSPSSRFADASPSRGGRSNPMDHAETFGKLSRGDPGYGGNAFCGRGRPAEGLLAIKLRELDVQPGGDDSAQRP